MTRSKFCWKALRCLLLIHLVSNVEIDANAMQKIYHHDQTIAVVEIAPDNKLMNCELIETNDQQRSLALINESISITFNKMVELISRCSKLEPTYESNYTISDLSFGIYPGTKWCGAGNIAKNYYDLGYNTIDKCCRAHDFCPVRISRNDTRYDIMNKFKYTLSHCTCEDELLKCALASNSKSAFSVMYFYFDFSLIPCIADGKDGKKQLQPAKKLDDETVTKLQQIKN